MRTVDLYIRVSTEEQADKGYSQRSQEELLRRYCSINNLFIRKVIVEDHSAKTFDRPAWKRYLVDLHKHRNKSDGLLFLKWDRFSRNAGDAYVMIKRLRKLGVEPQAIEQPLDLAIPENKMMLAFYLAAPEVENDRRALNVIHGMRRAQKEGRFIGLAPFGYANKTAENGRKYIEISEPQATIMRWAFDQISKGIYNTEQIYKLAKSKGFTRTKSLFWDAIRNPVYYGKIPIKKYKDEEASVVNGQHEPLISEELFYKVQDVLDGRKRSQYRLKVASDISLPLRGFLLCPQCDKILSGSASKGRSKYYSYYHCFDGCTCRFAAKTVNQLFVSELAKYSAKPELVDVYKALIAEAWDNQTDDLKYDRTKFKKQIKEIEDKIAYSRELLMSKQIEPSDFREMKARYNYDLERLESQLNEQRKTVPSIDKLLESGLKNLMRLDDYYEVSEIEKKREIIGSIFPEKLTYDGNVLRTTRVNHVVSLIYQVNRELATKKDRTIQQKFELSGQEVPSGFEPL